MPEILSFPPRGIQGAIGPQGAQGVFQGASPPADTSLLWVDTTAPGTTSLQGTQGTAGSTPVGTATISDVLMLGGM